MATTQNTTPAAANVSTGTGVKAETVITVEKTVTTALIEVNKAESVVENRREALFLAIREVMDAKGYDKKQGTKMLGLSYLTTAIKPSNWETLDDESKNVWERSYLLSKSAEISKTLTLAKPEKPEYLEELNKAMEHNKSLPKNAPARERIGYKSLMRIATGDATVESIEKEKAYSKPQGSRPSAKKQAEQAAIDTQKKALENSSPNGPQVPGSKPEDNQPPTPQASSLSPKEKLQGAVAALYANFGSNFGMSKVEIFEIIQQEQLEIQKTLGGK
jgi:hypothetical protein